MFAKNLPAPKSDKAALFERGAVAITASPRLFRTAEQPFC
jgi:hypothetical protein